jgi:hypothetical protein
MAAMLSIGYKPRTSNRQPNGTLMRRNMKKKVNSRSGMKKSERYSTSKKSRTTANAYRGFQRKITQVNNL